MNSDFLKPTVGKIITTLLFGLLMLLLFRISAKVIYINLTSYTIVKGISFVVLLFILYYLSCLIFNEFKWYKSLLFLVMGIVVIFSVLPGYWYYSYLLGQAESCDSCFGSPICTMHPLRTCECLGTKIGMLIRTDSNDLKCLGETRYTFYWYPRLGGKTFFNSPLKTFNSIEEWQQYCDGLNEGSEKDGCYISLNEAVTWKAD